METISIELQTSSEHVSDSPPPKKVTTSLEIPPDQVEKSLIARKQLENLSKKPRKKSSPAPSDSEPTVTVPKEPEMVQEVAVEHKEEAPELLYDGKPTMNNLTSAIISKEELEDEIRKKVAKVDGKTSFDIGAIEIPQELILSELNTAPIEVKEVEHNEQGEQLDEQQLIDILEGKDDQNEEEGQIIEFSENGMIFVKGEKNDQLTSYEIISTEDEKMASTKQKLLEREIAMRQIASMPTRKNRKLKPSTSNTAVPGQKTTSLVQSLAMDWGDEDKGDEVILELENVEGEDEPKIKILNMTILNEATTEDTKTPAQPQQQKITKIQQLPVYKPEPKILNKNAPKNVPPKILNVNAPKSLAEEPKRVPKKKTIWDPSSSTTSPVVSPSNEKKVTATKLPINLPPTITIKKLTKESLTNQAVEKGPLPVAENPKPTRKGKKKSEIDKLFQDEGAVNMIYSLERRNNNADVQELEVSVDKSMVDKTEEKTKLIAKAKTIKQTIMKQSTYQQEAKLIPARPQRIKRDLTPSKTEPEPEKKSSPQEKTVIITKAQKAATAGRKRKTDDSWDYVRKAQTTCDDAMIIRRHSNSSYSSSAPTSPRRLSLDQPINEEEAIKNGFKFTKPQEKTPEIQKDIIGCVGGLVEELRNTLSSKLAKGKANAEKAPKGKRRTTAAGQESQAIKRERRSNVSDKEYKIVKDEAVTQIILSANPITITLLAELKTLLGQLETDESCKVVLITASDEFSQGLDFSTLVQTTNDKRKQAASDLVTAVK